MKMMFHIDDFKCTLCTNWFCPPFNLPYLLPCTHSICTSCLQKATQNNLIICPEDLEQCTADSVNLNINTKRALERLMKEHRNYSENTQLECVKNLALAFDEIFVGKQKKLRNLQILMDQIFTSEIERLKRIHDKIKMDINRPFKIVEDWKEIVSSHLTHIRKNHQSANTETKSVNMAQLNHYIEEGRKMRMEINAYFNIDFDQFADRLMRNPRACFEKDFTVSQDTLQKKLLKGLKDEKGNGSILGNKYESISNSSRMVKQNKKDSLNGNSDKKIKEQVLFNQNTSVHLSHRKCDHWVESKPLSSLDMNSSVSESRFSGHLGQQTKGNQQKVTSNQPKLPSSQEIQNLQKFINTDQSNESRMSQPKVNRNFTEKKNTKGSQILNQNHFPFTSHKNSSLSLSQYHFQSLHNQNFEYHEVKQPTQISQKQLNYDFETENERRNKLAKMLQNSTPNQSHMQSVRDSVKSRNPQINSSADNSLLVSPQTIKQEYTEQAQEEVNQQEQLLNEDEDNGWSKGNINFLKEWKFKSDATKQQPLQIRQNTYYYNCEKQKLSYMRKMQLHRVEQALKMTQIRDNAIELINQSLHDVDMNIYLSEFDWKHTNIEIVKLVKTSLNDDQLNILLNHLVRSNVKVLVLSGNNLTDICLDAFLNFVHVNDVLKTVYLSKNYINILKTKNKIHTLREKGINVYI